MANEFRDAIQASQSSEVANCTIPIMSERRFAELRWRSIESRGRFWRGADAAYNLIHVPVNLASTIQQKEASFPSPKSLGFRARVEGMDHESNGLLHLHILSDLAGFTEQRLSHSARRNIRLAVKNHKVTVLKVDAKSLSLLVDQGYAALASSLRVNKYAPVPSREGFLEFIKASHLFSDENLVLAGLVDGRLAVYVTGTAVGDTAVLEQVVLNDQYNGTNVGSRTIFSFIEACQRTPGIKQINNWNVRFNDPGLTSYKESMGFPVTEIPVVVRLRPPFDGLFEYGVRRVRPGLYHKLYGRY